MRHFSQVFSCVHHANRSFTYLSFWSSISSIFVSHFYHYAFSIMKVNLFLSSNSLKNASYLFNHMSTKWSSVLLTILNSNWLLSWSPQSWCSACAVPFLKKWREPEDVRSDRPIALTLTIKVLGRFFANCLSRRLGVHLTLSHWQTGLHSGRRTTDQCLPLTQFISDGFSLPIADALLTHENIADRCPHQITELLSSWFINRSARGCVNISIRLSRTFKEGFPTGYILSTICIYDVLVKFIDDTFLSA